jgi:uncharacterized ion transporter superfamily protein YfcC
MAKKSKKKEFKKDSVSEGETVKRTPAQEKEWIAIQKWEKEREMGRNKYILIKGTLSWSLLTTSILILLTMVTNKFSLNQDLLWYFLKMFVLFIGIGTLFGIASWQLSENRYTKYFIKIKNKNPSK